MAPRVVVVGGGVTGLTAAWRLTEEAPGLDVVVLEASDRVGGKLLTGEIAGVPVELGADALLARHPAGPALVRRLGLDDDLVAPASGQVWVWTRGRLRRLPPGTVLGAPADPVALVRSRVLAPAALLRAAVEPLVPRRPVGGDRSVGDLVGERFGRAVVDTLVDPLLGGVYAGRADDLSVEATAPMVADAACRGSLLRNLTRRRDGQVGEDGPVFLTLRSGLSRLSDTLAARLGERVRVGVEAIALERRGDGWVVARGSGEEPADAVVLATPAYVTSRLLTPVAREAAAELAGIDYASVAVVTLAYPPEVDATLPPGSGMLVPPSEGRLVKASTWVSRKWPHRAGVGWVLVRASVGRSDDERWRGLDEDELVRRVDAEIRWATGIPRPAAHAEVTVWERSLPQYRVGHRERVDRIRMRLPEGIVVAGAAYDGVGISPCIASAERAVGAVRALLTGDRAGRT